MLEGNPAPSSVINGNRSSNGTILTVPAGATYTCDITISGGITVAGTGHPTVTVSGAGAIPGNGSVIADLTLPGLALVSVVGSSFTEAVVVAPPGNSVDLVFNVGGASAASVTVNGHTF